LRDVVLGEADFVFGVGCEANDAASVFVVAGVEYEAEGLVPCFGFDGAILDGTFASVFGWVIEADAFEGWDGGGLRLDGCGDE
jgi:hypothetical protein